MARQYNGAVTGNIANNATLVFANPNASLCRHDQRRGQLAKDGRGPADPQRQQHLLGPSNVNAGTLLISGSLATPTVTVANGATLTGAGNGTTTGLIAGNVTVNGGGAIDFTRTACPRAAPRPS